MCGIVGQYCFSGDPDKDLISKMSKTLIHRGPDADGTYFNSIVGLAHRRLSIIDLSKEANQPMFNNNKKIVIVYNGELYNYKQLKFLLLEKGHIFKTNSDTEVVIHAYEEWGINSLTLFNGMFAFALWDNDKKVLFCARDRFGIKPFYYALTKNSFLFASEIKTLLVHPNIGTEPHDLNVNIFLSSGIQDHSNRTMFLDVYQLEPSHGLIITNNHIKQFRYCDLEVTPNTTSVIPDDDIAINTQQLLKQSVNRQLMSDVPIGTCLSGGIDSSAIARIISETHPMQNTFSVCFSDERFDESNYIKIALHNTDISPFFIEPTPLNLIHDIDNLVYMQDEPFGSLSIYAQYCVMQLAHNKVKVLLDGQGADELFGGYLAYQKNYISHLIKKKDYVTACKETIGSLKHHRSFYSYAARQVFERNKRKKLFTNYVKTHRYGGDFSDLLHKELFVTNLPALLHYEDRNSMAFSIEARVPYLDTEFTNYIAYLPHNQKIRNGVTKFALRNALKGIIPDKIRNRMDKMGFVTPEESWMRYELKDYIMDIIYSTSFKNRPYWNSDKVLNDYQKFVNGKSSYSPELWRIISVELWLRKFFDNRSTLFSGIF
jgi:asparagine synthase (glutamine-hydrolysing)